MTRPFRILHAEDSIGDAELTRVALGEGKVPFELFHVRDGVEALAFLRNEEPYAESPRPDLILLDLNMPRMGGHEVLGEVKGDDALASIPVIVLTMSNSPDDVSRTYELHVNSYVRKPIDFDQFLLVMRAIEAFWLDAAVLPPES
jgi:CheY-like chemotaxis protein